MAYRRNGAAVAAASVALPAIETEREFDFTDADFQSLVRLAYEHAGIALAESKRNLVYSRLARACGRSVCDPFKSIATISPPTAPSLKASSTPSRPT
jgi:CheR methyltransferase, all-alpha domain